MRDHILNVLFFAGYIGTFVGAIASLAEQPYAFYVFATGVATLVGYRVATLQSGNFRIKRLNALIATSTVLFVGAGVMMYKNISGWVLALFIAAIIDLVVSFRYPNSQD